MALALGMMLEAAMRAELIDAATAERVRADVRKRRVDPVEALSRAGRVPVAAIYQAVAKTKGIPYMPSEEIEPVAQLVRRIPEALIRRRQVLPVAVDAGGVLLATSDPDDQQLCDALRRILNQPVRFALAEPESLELAIDRALDRARPGGSPLAFPLEVRAEEPVEFVDRILREAFIRRATDVHIEPQAGGYRIRFRIDGALHVYRTALRPQQAGPAVSRIKVLAGLNIAESRESQDGNFTYALKSISDQELDIRVATSPTRFGERVTLRLLGVDAEELTLETLGLSQKMLATFQSIIRRPHGLILNTGATGSGKTTTLYAALQQINDPKLNILTVEDPIEYSIPGVSQLQIDRIGKVTFARALRSLLRHDPDILMIGEIRDLETVEIALRAAMTGHLVFSTLHTNTACGAVTRLIDMGCAPYLLGSTLTAVIAQRLVRRLCTACRRPHPIREGDRAFFDAGDAPQHTYEPVGCPLCIGTGYRSRIAIFEVLVVDRNVRHVIVQNGSEAQIVAAASDGGFLPLWKDAIAKVSSGVTSVDEVRSVLDTEV